MSCCAGFAVQATELDSSIGNSTSFVKDEEDERADNVVSTGAASQVRHMRQ
jgi:hypothetical protein